MFRFLAFVLFLLSFCVVLGQGLKPGDVINLKCLEDPSLNGEYTVTNSGLILIQFVGAVEVSGLTEEQAAAKISKTLVNQQILKTATITVSMRAKEIVESISYSGAVKNAGEMAYREGLTLEDVLKAAEPTITADLTQIRISRANGEVGTIDFSQFTSGNPAANPLLRPGDKIFIPLKVASLELTVLGAVNKPGIISFKEGMTIRQAIDAAGGMRTDGDWKKIELRTDSESKILDLSDGSTDPVLNAGARLVVGVREITDYVYVRGAVARPGLIPFMPNMTISQAVLDAQPFDNARLDSVRLTRKELDKDLKPKPFDINKIKDGEREDFLLQPGDVIEVGYPGKSYSNQKTMQYVGIGLLLFFLFRR